MNKVAKNAVWIIGIRIVQSVVTLLINMLTARYLGPSNFGLITYASSLVAFVLPIMQLGFSNVLVQEIVNDSDAEGTILGTSITLSLISSACCIVGVTSFAFIAKAMMEHVIYANARVAAERGGTTICCTRYGNVMCSRGSVIPLFIDQIKAGNPITITDPNMTRFLMNLDEAVDLVMFAFQHANPGDLFIQKADASTIGDLAKAVQQFFGDTGSNIIGTRHGEKLFETLMTREERLRSQDMGHYFRVAADNRDLNYDKFVVKGEVHTMADESYTSHNTTRLDVEGTVKKILTTDYVQNEMKNIPNV